ncbi:MAG: RIP metalloprotease RseP [Gammaproteobacteria bacterium]|nr:RIP metalloprotease RseP [Pseudomonadales bacterium]MCP5346417.1 RIP metalloprotease RseP [Pseudomonadales bacterium]
MLATLIFNVLALVVTLGILVTFHEYGHFWVARRCGVRVLRFSIGFGKPFKSWYGKDGVEYAIAPIPLGGYVKMLGQEDTSVTDASEVPLEQRHESFAFKPLWQRMAIVAAGPIANFILAAAVFWVINLSYGVTGLAPVLHSVVDGSPADRAGLRAGDEIVAVDGSETRMWQQVSMKLLERLGETGEIQLTVTPHGSTAPQSHVIPIINWLADSTSPDPLTSLGMIQFDLPPVIASVVPGGRAEAGGLLPGDEVLTANGQAVRGWGHWVEIVRASPELDLDVVVQRGSETIELHLIPERTLLENNRVIGTIGAAVEERSIADLLPPERQRSMEYNAVSAVIPALQETWDKSVFVLDSVKKMVVGLISVKNINGPITIAQVAGETASYGLDVYLGFLAILSISLGVLNLLPIPVLDGGHLLYYVIEGVIRRPVPERIQELGLQLGLLLISGIMILAVYNDVSRLL